MLVYAQATQDGCSLALCTSPLLNQCLLHLHPTHLTDLPTYLPLPQLVIVLDLDQSSPLGLSRGGEGHATLLVSLVTDEPT